MDYRLNRIDSEEKDRILSLHESATNKEYLVTGKKPLFEQEESNVQQAANLIYKACKGLGTDTDMLIKGVMKIRSVEEFKEVDNILKASNYGDSSTGFVDMINGELGMENQGDAKEIMNHLNSIGVNATAKIGVGKMMANSFKITGFSENQKQGDQQQGIGKERDLNWRDRYSCVANYEGAEKVQLKDKSHAYKINGVVFYNNGRKMENGQMSNYSCNDEMFKGQTKTEDPKPTETKKSGGSLRDMTITIQKEVGVDPDGRFGPKSINAAYEALTK
jgi:hypothetical protein